MENRKKRNWKLFAIIGIVLVVIIAAVLGWYYGYKVPHDKKHAASYEAYSSSVSTYNEAADKYNSAVDAYNEVISAIQAENTKVDEKVDAAQSILDSDFEPYGPATKEALSDAIGKTLGALVEVPTAKDKVTLLDVAESDSELSIEELDEKTANIQDQNNKLATETSTLGAETSELAIPDYTATLADLDVAKKAFEDSVKVLEQVTNPSEDFVISRITGLENIGTVAPVTEDHDPNGNLNKEGGYTATVYFSSPLVVDEYSLFTGNVIDDGTDGGGSIEVYANVEDATKRNEYLASFDGGFLASGSHTIVGTCLVRTSNELTASQQKALEAEIIEALTRLGK